MPPAACKGCGSSNPNERADANGSTFCTSCGAVQSESNIDIEVSFTTDNVATGQNIRDGQAGIQRVGRFRMQLNEAENRQKTLDEVRRSMEGMASALGLPIGMIDTAVRWYTLALSFGFTKGKRSTLVQAACIYYECRTQKRPCMLIDFSDLLRVNVFKLGHVYLRFIRAMCIDKKDPSTSLPAIDPAMYILRFAKHLEFGDETNKVAESAIRIVQRMDRDWMVSGRRPSGICGAALILAARMHNFRRSVREVVYIVKVSDDTVQRRLKEFKETKSGELTVDEFRKVWLEDEKQPPCVVKQEKRRKRKRRVRKVDDDGEVIMDEDEMAESVADTPAPESVGEDEPASKRRRKNNTSPELKDIDKSTRPGSPSSDKENDPSALLLDSEKSKKSSTSPEPSSYKDNDPSALPDIESSEQHRKSSPGPSSDKDDDPNTDPDYTQKRKKKPPTSKRPAKSAEPEETPEEAHLNTVIESAIENEITDSMTSPSAVSAADALSLQYEAYAATLAAKLRTNAVSTDKDLTELDDDSEVEGAILTRAEQDLKERIWVTENGEWLKYETKRLLVKDDKEAAEKKLKEEAAANGEVVVQTGKKGRRRGLTGGSKPIAESAAEAAKMFMKTKTFSKKINYGVYDSLFED